MQDRVKKAQKAKRQAWKTGFVSAVYALSAADVESGAIRLGKARFLFDPKASTGVDGATAPTKLTVEFNPGAATEAELTGKGRLVDGAATRAFLDAIQAKAGDRLLVERTGANSIRVSRVV